MLQNKDKPVLLVVDDAINSIRLVNEILKDDYRIKVATNGAIALTVAQNTRPDIILLDVVMPVMNGYETCRRLKENRELKDIPIIFLTAKTDEEDEEKGFALGAADYISKPVSPRYWLPGSKCIWN
ncbi:MAG: response regulator [Candidatus Syntrophopropionicum ammoniitolerans]